MKVLAKGNAKKNRYESTTKATIPTSTLDYMLYDYRNPVCIPTSTLTLCSTTTGILSGIQPGNSKDQEQVVSYQWSRSSWGPFQDVVKVEPQSQGLGGSQAAESAP